MHINDNDSPTSAASRPSLGWHKPKRVRVGSLIYQHHRPQPGDPIVPCIKLRGMWMAEAGIAPGTRLTVEMFDGAILLRAAEPAGRAGEFRAVRRSSDAGRRSTACVIPCLT